MVVYRRNGAISTSIVPLDGTGSGRRTVAFSSRSVTGVDAVLVNTSARFADCFQHQTVLSCSGVPRDDGQKYRVTGAAFRS